MKKVLNTFDNYMSSILDILFSDRIGINGLVEECNFLQNLLSLLEILGA
jgi:hypothetical protein